MNTEHRLKALGIELPPSPTPRYTYVPFRRAGEIVFLSGQVPRLPDGTYLTGKLGQDRTMEEGVEAARLCGLHMLASARSITGSLDDVEFIKLLGMVNATPDFKDHGQVLEGCSKLLVEVMGERGQHARSAVGMGSLPANIRVEIEAVLRVLG
ncbi:RidA family protein [Dongia sedimenti]|uniref:RidA family protein n=1 Tax=Dongia sedimenti TaxID=3064282 RepID=A0ABU0YPW4_9PROT|nr:RidA family protein [Rhodospirillaceae bacterium R-7]